MPSRSVVSVLLLAALLNQAAAQAVVHEAGEPGLDPPRLIEDSRVQPTYPEEAVRDGVQGTVLLRLVVTEYGLVGNVEIFRSPFGGEALAQAAVDAVRQWRYHPAQLQGRDVACRIMQTVPFYPPSTKPAEKRSRGTRRNKKQPPPRPAAAPEAEPAHETPVKAAPPAAPAATPPSQRKEVPPAPEVEPPAAAETAPVPPSDVAPSPEKQPEPPTGVTPLPPPEAAPAPEPAQPPEPAPRPRPPIPRPVAPPVIELGVGGPRGLLLGQPGEKVRALPAAAGQEGADVLRLPELGMDVTLGDSPRGERIVAIRYRFAQEAGMPASGLRTRKGLGHGSFCLGIVPAYGRPDERRESTDENGDDLLSLEYRGEEARSVFVCRDGRLAELFLEQVQP